MFKVFRDLRDIAYSLKLCIYNLTSEVSYLTRSIRDMTTASEQLKAAIDRSVASEEALIAALASSSATNKDLAQKLADALAAAQGADPVLVATVQDAIGALGAESDKADAAVAGAAPPPVAPTV